MNSQNAYVHDTLERALLTAAEMAGTRLGRQAGVRPGDAPSSSALLRFEVSFADGSTLDWLVSNEDATGFSDLLIGGTGDRGAVLTEAHLDALSGIFSAMLEVAVAFLDSTTAGSLGAGGVDMGMEGSLPAPVPGGDRSIIAIDIDGFGSLAIVQQASPGLVTAIAASHPSGDAPSAAPKDRDMSNVVPLPSMSAREGGQPLRSDLGMLLNVPLNVTVELGRTERSVRELIELNVGSIIELSKLAGDPMDILVNGKVLAKGEVVVIDEEFGVRITEILSPEERLRNMG